LTSEEFRAYETKLNSIRSNLAVERKMGAFPQMNSSTGDDDEGDF
jgi:hypothetical protein